METEGQSWKGMLTKQNGCLEGRINKLEALLYIFKYFLSYWHILFQTQKDTNQEKGNAVFVSFGLPN